jgi:hypothetical protein
MTKYLLTTALFFLTTVGSVAYGLTLAEKKKFNEWQEYLKDENSSYVKTVKTKCGYDIPVALDEKFTTTFMKEGANAASYCDETRSKISYMCEDATSKEAIKSKIKKIQCTHAKNAEDATFKLTGGTLTFTYGVKASNIGDKVKEFLENNL